MLQELLGATPVTATESGAGSMSHATRRTFRGPHDMRCCPVSPWRWRPTAAAPPAPAHHHRHRQRHRDRRRRQPHPGNQRRQEPTGQCAQGRV